MQRNRLWNAIQKDLLFSFDYLVERFHIAKFRR